MVSVSRRESLVRSASGVGLGQGLGRDLGRGRLSVPFTSLSPASPYDLRVLWRIPRRPPTPFECFGGSSTRDRNHGGGGAVRGVGKVLTFHGPSLPPWCRERTSVSSATGLSVLNWSTQARPVVVHTCLSRPPCAGVRREVRHRFRRRQNLAYQRCLRRTGCFHLYK